MEETQVKSFVEVGQSSFREKPSSSNSSEAGVDQAWEFLDKHRDAVVQNDSVDIDALRRKIDFRIVPLMFACYTMQFLDKVILNVRVPAFPFRELPRV